MKKISTAFQMNLTFTSWKIIQVKFLKDSMLNCILNILDNNKEINNIKLIR